MEAQIFESLFSRVGILPAVAAQDAATLTAWADAAVEALAHGLARELSPVRVNVVAPGLIETPLIRNLPADQKAAFQAKVAPQPVPRMGTPEEIAEAILWVMGNGFATGTVLEVDGGYKLS